MWIQTWNFFLSWFAHPDITGISLAISFGIIWLVAFWPPLIRRPRLWAVLLASALVTLVSVSLVQIPLQVLVGRGLGLAWSQGVLAGWIMLTAIPQILVSGLIQEGAKLVPVVFWWWRSGKNISPLMGLLTGAVAGAGLGIFEAQWVHGMVLRSGWSWSMVSEGGLITLVAFWERFIIVAFHISVTALAGYGLARGWGWQLYLVAALLHSVTNYSAAFVQSGLLSYTQVEVFVTAWVVLITAGVLWLRWRETGPLSGTGEVREDPPGNVVENGEKPPAASA